MGYYKYLAKLWRNPLKNNREEYKQNLLQWRKESSVVRISDPTRPDRARALGYRAKNCFVISRVKIKKGGRMRPQLHAGRKPSKTGQKRYSSRKSFGFIAEERAQRKHPNLEVLNSYWVGDDSHHVWYEVILVDPCHPQVFSDKNLRFLIGKNSRKRVLRGLTFKAKKMRGLKK